MKTLSYTIHNPQRKKAVAMGGGRIAALLLREVDVLIAREERRLRALRDQSQRYADLTCDEVIEIMSAARCPTLWDQIDKIPFIAMNYRRVTAAINSEARRELKRDIAGCRGRRRSLLHTREKLRRGNLRGIVKLG